MNASGDEFLTVAEIAEILKLNQQTVRNWIDHGTLPALHVGRRVRIRRSDFEALLERGRPVAPPVSERWQGRGLLGGGATPGANGRPCRRGAPAPSAVNTADGRTLPRVLP